MLDARDHSRRDPENPFVTLLWERGTHYEKETIAKLTLPYLDLSGVKKEDKERETLAAMRRGETLIYGGRIVADDLLGEPDILRKEVGGYIPGDIKAGAGEEGGGEDSDGKPKLHYAVQLALYVDILERLRLSTERKAFIWDISMAMRSRTILPARKARRNRTPFRMSIRRSSLIRVAP